MCIRLVLVVMSVSELNVALPTLVRELGPSAQQLQWIADAAVAAGTGGAAGSAIAEAAATGFTNGVARSFAAAAALSLVAPGLLRRGFASRAPSAPSTAAQVAAAGRRSGT